MTTELIILEDDHGRTQRVLVGGVDIAPALQGLQLRMDAEGRTTVLLEVHPDLLAIQVRDPEVYRTLLTITEATEVDGQLSIEDAT